VSSSLTAVVILVTLLHVGAFALMIWIRVRRSEADGTPGREREPHTMRRVRRASYPQELRRA
jgi:hypothetical protein